MRGGRRLAMLVLVGAVVLTAAPRAARAHAARERAGPAALRGSPSPSLAVIGPAPPFALVDPTGRSVSLADYAGRVVLLSFVYTTCRSACPLVTQRMAVLQRRLREAGLFGSRVGFVSITVDPDRDGGATLARYAKAFGADPRGWTFLRDRPDALRPVLAAWDEWTRPLPRGEIDHPPRRFLLDGAGRIRGVHTLAPLAVRQRAPDPR